jgi:rhodanese-related sulfurtransferase
MPNQIVGAALALLLPLAAFAQAPTLTVQKPAAAPSLAQMAPEDGARRIGAEEALLAVAKGNAILVDVRSKEAFNFSHAKDAKSIPLQEIPDRLSEMPRDRLIIAYCTCPAEQSSVRAVLDLKGKGITNAAALVGGLHAWEEAKGEVESAPRQQ